METKKEEATAAEEAKAELVVMTKDGEELAVHESCVVAHEGKGWVVVDA